MFTGSITPRGGVRSTRKLARWGGLTLPATSTARTVTVCAPSSAMSTAASDPRTRTGVRSSTWYSMYAPCVSGSSSAAGAMPDSPI